MSHNFLEAPFEVPSLSGRAMPIGPLGGRSRLRLEAAARALNVSESDLEELVARGRVPGVFRQGSMIFVDLDEARGALAELTRDSVRRAPIDRGRIFA